MYIHTPGFRICLQAVLTKQVCCVSLFIPILSPQTKMDPGGGWAAGFFQRPVKSVSWRWWLWGWGCLMRVLQWVEHFLRRFLTSLQLLSKCKHPFLPQILGTVKNSFGKRKTLMDTLSHFSKYYKDMMILRFPHIHYRLWWTLKFPKHDLNFVKYHWATPLKKKAFYFSPRLKLWYCQILFLCNPCNCEH